MTMDRLIQTPLVNSVGDFLWVFTGVTVFLCVTFYWFCVGISMIIRSFRVPRHMLEPPKNENENPTKQANEENENATQGS